MLTAYFDETGVHKRARMTAMSGFVANAGIWSDVETRWRARLNEEESEFRAKVFHAVDCEHGYGEFKDLIYWNRTRRDLLTGDLAAVMASSDVSAISSGLLQADWDDVWANVASEDFRKRFPAGYHLCFEHCVQQAFTWAEQFADSAPIALVFAEHQEHRDWAEKILKAYQESPHHGHKIASLTFSSPQKLVPLQSADLLVYEFGRSLKEPGLTYQPRPAIAKLIAGLGRLYGGYYDREALVRLVKAGLKGEI